MISAWIKWDGTVAEGVIAGITGGGSTAAKNNIAVMSITSTGKLQMQWHSGIGVSHTITSTGSVSSGVWTYVAAEGALGGGNITYNLWVL